ncbi:MAG: low molecular weight phosphatase family protein [Puniceicoccales bacterium]|jgi:protein-tyrosine phosphatase|nr:low molecular weight phosphatase family protein [Puniceicoccales bacterium]
MHILFLCSGNYYRSRFAEAVFNFHAARLGLDSRASSRGLATHLVTDFDERISPNTVAALAARGIPQTCTSFRPQQVTNADLATAHRIIALKESEHRPMLRLLYPGWEDRVEYWHIHDVESGTPETQLPRIEEKVLQMLATLQ